MTYHPLAGKPAPSSMTVNIPGLISAYYTRTPDPAEAGHRVSFGTSGHRGISFDCSFNEAHIMAVTQAVCDYRRQKGISGPLFLGMDTHALSEAAHTTAIEVLAANEVQVMIQEKGGYTPTPVISHAILCYNRGRTEGLADGIVITPSHNPPESGGFKYNPPHGGPADTACTRAVEDRANALLESGNKEVRRMPVTKALSSSFIKEIDFVAPYVADLANVLDMEAIAGGNISIGVDPMGGSGIAYWEPIAEKYGLKIEVVNPRIDPTFSFMTLDKDGKIRMDCSSPCAMAGLIGMKDRFDIAFGNDPDTDRHGIVTPTGLMNPNHYLAVAIWYLFQNRPDWPEDAATGKTLVSSAMIDRVAKHLGRRLAEVPVGFKWFVEGLLEGRYGFGGEESAGASFLRRDGTVWTTDKDGIILNLLAAEITVKEKADPARIYENLTEKFGKPVYTRIDAPANREQKIALSRLKPEQVTAGHLAGEPIISKLTKSPEGNASIGGLKVLTENGWFAARPSGTEDIYKIYAESFIGEEHLGIILKEAQEIVDLCLENTG